MRFTEYMLLDEKVKSVNVIKSLPAKVKLLSDEYGITIYAININQTALDVLGLSSEFSSNEDSIQVVADATIESIKILVHLFETAIYNPSNYDWKDVISAVYNSITKTKKVLFELYVDDDMSKYSNIKALINDDSVFKFICHTVKNGSLPITFKINSTKMNKALVR